jgi:hypothetical protein
MYINHSRDARERAQVDQASRRRDERIAGSNGADPVSVYKNHRVPNDDAPARNKLSESNGEGLRRHQLRRSEAKQNKRQENTIHTKPRRGGQAANAERS